MANITIKDLYDRLEANRLETSQSINRLSELIEKRDIESRAEFARLAREIYGFDDVKGIKYQVATNTAKIGAMDTARGVAEWRQFIMTVVTGFIAAITGATIKN